MSESQHQIGVCLERHRVAALTNGTQASQWPGSNHDANGSGRVGNVQ